MADIFKYQNFRDYLKAYYEEQKAAKKAFSYRSFSQQADFSSPSFIYNVIEGRRNLTKTSIVKLSRAIGLTREEADYFENLVFFNQAKTVIDKTTFYSRIAEMRRSIDIEIVTKERYQYFSDWYHSVIREVVAFYDFKDDYTKLGSFLTPAISAKQARDSVRLLEKLGFIAKQKNGCYAQVNSAIAAKPSAVESFLIERFQMEMLQMALRSYQKIPLSDRMSSSTTFSVSRETFELFKQKARDFRRELAEIAKLDSSPDCAYQFTMNLFPLSRSVNNDK
ncbi:TIGR02147 family protein [Chitinispirillales bacterium ANBcel5]|uniref:TIGR02147 family protein n=1 Tax=Cellulosispirillum alkaliphilum TaxID=3039283 RepID=UPI002A57D349|nr:TIGR02147 family protein [Chitinispirillales bacterium ANBcel5]